jgi:hypothetical protein
VNLLLLLIRRWRPSLASLLLAAVPLAHAQTQPHAQPQPQKRLPSVRPAPQQSAPAVVPKVAVPAAPSPSGLRSPSRYPGGLVSQFPAGVPSPVPSAAGIPSPAMPNVSALATVVGSAGVDASADVGLAPPTHVLGAAGYGGAPVVAPPAAHRAGPITALEIAQSFIGADSNRDGELTRAEAQRLTLMPYSFEEMDRNRDGILTRFEYEDGVR